MIPNNLSTKPPKPIGWENNYTRNPNRQKFEQFQGLTPNMILKTISPMN